MKKLARNIALVLLMLAVGIIAAWAGSAFFYPEKPPMEEATEKYRVHYSLAAMPPFLFKYYLYSPSDYDPAQSYPLVLMLHGSSRHMHGGIYATRSGVQNKHPMFVLVPIAPPYFRWAKPGFPLQAHGFAARAIKNVFKSYAIDPNRVYVTGYSLGGAGTFGMLAHYPDLFAAAAPLCGYWSEGLADYRAMPDIPVQIHHGTQDSIVPYERSEDAYTALKTLNVDVELKPHYQRGHNIWDTVYRDEQFWDWLMMQRR